MFGVNKWLMKNATHAYNWYSLDTNLTCKLISVREFKPWKWYFSYKVTLTWYLLSATGIELLEKNIEFNGTSEESTEHDVFSSSNLGWDLNFREEIH